MSSTSNSKIVTKSSKKVLFVITKANWGEKWAGTHFARLIEVFFELAKKSQNEWTASVRRCQAAPQYKYLSYGHTK